MKPLERYLKELGEWPVVMGDSWPSDSFSLTKMLYKMREFGLTASSLFSFRVNNDMKNTSWRILEVIEPKANMNDFFTLLLPSSLTKLNWGCLPGNIFWEV